MKFLRDYKTYLIIASISAGVFGYLQLPGRVDALAEDIKTVDSKVEKLAQAMHEYAAVQNATQTLKAEQDKEHRILLMELIKKMVEK